MRLEDDDVDAAVRTVLDRYGRFEVLVSNAGQTLNVPIGDIDFDDIRAILDPSLVASLRVLHAVLSCMHEQGPGTVVNVSSGITLQAFPDTAPMRHRRRVPTS